MSTKICQYSEVRHLLAFLTLISDHKFVPGDCQIGLIKPLHKSSSMDDLDNYRGIILTSNVYMIQSKVLEEFVMTYLEDDKIIWEVQGASKEDS